MTFEMIEINGAWGERLDGVEIARFNEELNALAEVAERFRGTDEAGGAYALAMRDQERR